MSTTTMTVLVIDEYADEHEMTVPAVFEVCWRCEGKGVHDHKAFSNGISMQEFDEDPDFRESYYAGHYDVQCSECKGARVLPTPAWMDLTADQAHAVALYEKHLDLMERMAADDARTRCMENGGY